MFILSYRNYIDISSHLLAEGKKNVKIGQPHAIGGRME